MTDAELGGAQRGDDDAVARELRALGAQIAALQADVRRLEGTALPDEGEAGWDDPPPVSFEWLSPLAPLRRPAVRIPRLPLELAFLAGAAALAGVADLRPLVIAGVMAGAWLIVALAEWAGARGDRLRHRLLLASSAVVHAPEPIHPDPAWFSPPVEQTLHAPAVEAETAIARLPPAPDPETTVEQLPGT